jgi:hypothetical protein
MACCIHGIFEPLVLDCSGNYRTLQAGERIRFGDVLVGSKIITVTTDTELNGNTIVFADASAAALTVTLPEGFEGLLCSVQKIDATGNVVTIDGYGSETINGHLDAAMGVQNTNLTFLFHNGEWRIM